MSLITGEIVDDAWPVSRHRGRKPANDAFLEPPIYMCV